MLREALPPEKWFEKFTYVEQEQKLFWATIEENILLGEERDEERLPFTARNVYGCTVSDISEMPLPFS